eukprot:8882319-Pyramimonas_sp.AAC.2
MCMCVTNVCVHARRDMRTRTGRARRRSRRKRTSAAPLQTCFRTLPRPWSRTKSSSPPLSDPG